jgi:hypothetical protein
MSFVKHTIFGVSYYVRRIFREDPKNPSKVTRKGAPTQEKTIHIAALSQDEAVAHAHTIAHDTEVGGVKDTENREVTVTGVTNGTKAVHVYVAPSASAEVPTSKPEPAKKADAPKTEAKAEKPLDEQLKEGAKDAPSAT